MKLSAQDLEFVSLTSTPLLKRRGSFLEIIRRKIMYVKQVVKNIHTKIPIRLDVKKRLRWPISQKNYILNASSSAGLPFLLKYSERIQSVACRVKGMGADTRSQYSY
jgi:hypothetical protein